MPRPFSSRPARRSAAILLALLLAVHGAATPQLNLNLPSLGESSAGDLPPRMERRIGEEVMQQIYRNRDYLDDVEVSQYLNEMAAELVSHAGADEARIDVFAVRDNRINAFAMPGGFIGVHSATVLNAQTESELASVIGHEIGHVTQRHIARMLSRQKQDSWMTLAALAAAIIASRAGGDAPGAAMALGSAAQADSQMRFSRDAEREADRVGFQMLTGAGFDGTGMVGFFSRLQRATQWAESPLDIYVRSHPMTTERMADIQNRVQNSRHRQHADSEEFYFVRAKLRVLQEDSVQGYLQAADTLRAAAENTTGRLRAANWYGAAYAAFMRGAWNDADAALKKAGQLLGREPAMFVSLASRIRLGQRDAAGALQIAEAGARKYPAWRGLAYARIDALQGANRHADAIKFLRSEIANRPQEPKLYERIAQSHAGLDQRLQQHRMMAEYYARTGAVPAAVEQLQLARQQKGDFYEYSQIDARLRELRGQVEEEMRQRRAAGAER
jgi:predicted Zn-dependent protease